MARRAKKHRSSGQRGGNRAPTRAPASETAGSDALLAATSTTRPARFSRREFLGWAVGLLCLYAFLGAWGQFDFSNLMGYYSMLADGMLQGRLSIDYTPVEVNLIDMVPFEGRYYLQWGPVPAVFHLVVKLAGWELSDRVACLLAGWLASLAFLGILLKLRELYFGGLPLWVCRWLFLGFALGTPTAFVALRTTIYHESIGVAAMFIVFGCLALLRYIETRSPPPGSGFVGPRLLLLLELA